MNTRNDEAKQIVEAFLARIPHPNRADWKALMDDHEALAAHIAELSLAHGVSDRITDHGEPDIAIDQERFNESMSWVLNYLHDNRPATMAKAEKAISAALGAPVRALAKEIGIGDYPSLLSDVLVGGTLAPVRVLVALEKKWGVTSTAMVEVFRRTFEATEVPAFKAAGVKPEVQIRQRTWEESVKELSLTEGERARLLEFAKDG